MLIQLKLGFRIWLSMTVAMLSNREVLLRCPEDYAYRIQKATKFLGYFIDGPNGSVTISRPEDIDFAIHALAQFTGDAMEDYTVTDLYAARGVLFNSEPDC